MAKNWTIEDIENITEEQAKEMCGRQHMTIKGHECYFVDFGGYFGFSVLVFCEGRHIHYANDYALHHKYTKYNEDGTTERVEPNYGELLKAYIEGRKNKLFTDEELKTVKDYDDYRAKSEYLHNYYPMRREHLSMFFIGSDEEREKRRKQAEKMIFSPVAFGYFDEKDEGFAEHLHELYEGLEEAKNNAESYDYWKSAFKYEMFNHEYGINWQGDCDILTHFGFKAFREPDAEGFKRMNEIEARAYDDARREYYKETEEWG